MHKPPTAITDEQQRLIRGNEKPLIFTQTIIGHFY